MFITNIFLVTYLFIFQASALTLNNGRYEDIYIVIQDSIDENLELLDRIQEVFTEASELLFAATKEHVYFGKINIVIPKSWSTQTYYKHLPALYSLETYIDINNGSVRTPYVRFNNYKCGEQGVSMNLHHTFLLQKNRTVWGKHANVIVHEWGHLRWGLFDEYPNRFGNPFYQHAGEWKPVMCSHKIQGKVESSEKCNQMPADGMCNTKDTSKKMEENCYFCTYTEQNVTVSLMGFQYIDQSNRIGLLNQAGRYIIQECIPEGSWLGIVTFNTSAHTNKEITQINSKADRNNLITALPSSTDGYTCIACGIDESISILRDHLVSSVENGKIILISDGESNRGNINVSRSKAINAMVTINTIAVSQQADTLLSDIAVETEGKSYTYLESGNISLAAVFREAICGRSSITSMASQSALILSEKLVSNVIHTTFTIDHGLGNDTSVTVLTFSNDSIHLQLNGPTNYTQNATVNGNIATIKVNGFAEIGDYNLTITTSSIGQIVEYHVTSSPTVESNDVIRVESRLSKTNIDLFTKDLPEVFADVKRRNAPVLKASVKAIVESNGASCTFYLFDNGIDPDRLKNDGTYSGYILPQCLGSGRVHISIKANGKAGETFLLYGITGLASRNGVKEEKEETIDYSFQRSVVTEELYISNYKYDESVDSIAPGRITDVEINNIETGTTQSGNNRNLTLTWTATGDDRNQGQASLYEMRVSSDIGTLRDNFESAEPLNMTNSTIFPQSAGSIEALKIVVHTNESYIETMFFAVKAIDEAGNKGHVSNIVSIVVARCFHAYGEQGYPLNKTDDDIILDQEGTSLSQSRDTSDIKAVVTGVTVSCGVVLFLVIALLFVKKFKQRKYSMADSQVSFITKDISMAEVLSYQSNHMERGFTSISLPISVSSNASPEISYDIPMNKNH